MLCIRIHWAPWITLFTQLLVFTGSGRRSPPVLAHLAKLAHPATTHAATTHTAAAHAHTATHTEAAAMMTAVVSAHGLNDRALSAWQEAGAGDAHTVSLRIRYNYPWRLSSTRYVNPQW